jgi:ankyrin repeat protein
MQMNNTPLHLAALYGRLEIVQLFIEYNGDINATNELGSPIHWALEHNHLKVVELLLGAGARLDIADKVGCIRVDNAH